MILYQVVQPFVYSISANTVNEAIKNFVKIHHNLNLNNIIITDQKNNYEANLRYFVEDGRNRVGINTFPYSGPIVLGPTYAAYIDEPLPGVTGTPISPRVPTVPSNIWSNNYPLSPYPLSPLGFVPTIVNLR